MSTNTLAKEKMLRKRLRRMHKLYDTALAHVLTLNAKSVLHHLIRNVGEILGVDHCYIMLVQPETGHLAVQATWTAAEPGDEALGAPDAKREEGTGGSLAWAGVLDTLVVEHRSPMVIPDTSTFPDLYLAAPDSSPPASLVSLPLAFRDQVMGTLTVASIRPRTFDPEEVVALSQLVTPACLAIENERVHHDLRERLLQKEALLESTSRQLEQQRLVEELQAVTLDAARLAASSLNMMGTLDGFAELCARCLGATQVLLLQPAANHALDLVAAHGIGPEEETVLAPLLPLETEREALCCKAIRSGEEAYRDLEEEGELGPTERALVTCCRARALSAWPVSSPQGDGVVLLLFTTLPQRQQLRLDTMAGMVRQLGVFLQNTHLFEELRQRADQMRGISDIAEALNGSLDPASILSVVARNTQRLLSCDWTGLALVDRDQNLLRLTVTFARNELREDESRTFPLDEGVVHNAVSGGHPFICDALLGSRSSFEQYLLEEGLRSLLIVPLVIERKTVATLNLGRRRPGTFTSQQVELLQRLADHVATALKNAHALAAMAGANQELRRMDEVKSDFLSTVAHELRTPLTIIKGYLFILLRPQGLSDFLVETLETIDSQTDHLKELIENLLSLSKLEANKGVLAPNLQNVSMADLVEEVMGNFRLSARKKGVELKTEVPGTIVLKADRIMLLRVLYNLVGNALKFTQEGSVSVSARQIEGGRVICEVEDTGPGIAPEHMGRIFERFYHVEAKDQRAPTGTGLGLAIVESIVHAHGGRVWVNSELGKGTRFTFVLPLQPPAVQLKP